MSTYMGVTNFQKTVRFFWPTLYKVRAEASGSARGLTAPPNVAACTVKHRPLLVKNHQMIY